MKFLIGVVVVREQYTEMMVSVEAETREEAERFAVAGAMKVDQSKLQKVTQSLDWDASGSEIIVDGASDEDYISSEDHYSVDLDLTK